MIARLRRSPLAADLRAGRWDYLIGAVIAITAAVVIAFVTRDLVWVRTP